MDVDVDRDWYPGAAAAAAITTAAVIGSVVYSVPSTCVSTEINGIVYLQCEDTWYEPQFEGTTVAYVVVAPR